MTDSNDLVEYGFRRAIITITAILCALLEIVDTTIVNVALPPASVVLRPDIGMTVMPAGSSLMLVTDTPVASIPL